jgi:uncharacterized protein (TIGR02301 family)
LKRAAIVIASLAALFAAEAGAAETPAQKPGAKSEAKPAPAAGAQAPTPPTAAPERLPPYEPQLLRLAEIVGALAYLRDLCGAGDGAKFRSAMKALQEAEGADESQRDLLAGAYNRGFEGYRLSYRTCNAAAGEVIARFLTETARLSAELAGRYGG